MSGVSQGTIEEIKSRIDLVDLISSYGIQVKRAGTSNVACCPFHHEKTPSFHINADKGFYHCFGCGENGDVIKFVQKHEGLDFMDAIKKLASQCGIQIEESDTKESSLRKRMYALHAGLSQFFNRCLLQSEEAFKARSYIKSRKLSDEIVQKFAIGYVPINSEAILTWAKAKGFTPKELEESGILLPPKRIGDGYYNRFGGRLIFTINDRTGRPIAFSARILDNNKNVAKYVNSPETAIFKKSSVLFALDKAAMSITKSPQRQAIICEGQIDVIRCHASGFTQAVASQGTAFTQGHVNLLKRSCDSAVLVFDADNAGRKAAIKTGGLFLAAGIPVRVATLPGGEDPDSLLSGKGPEAFQKCLDEAETIVEFQVRVMLEAEKNPKSIDAVSKVSRAVIELLMQCDVSVVRAKLLADAARLLGVPEQALQDDFAKAQENAKYAIRRNKSVKEEEADKELIEEDGASKVVWKDAKKALPPSSMEMELCKLLAENEGNKTLAEMLTRFAPSEIFSHEFTKRFVSLWCSSVLNQDDSFNTFPMQCSEEEMNWFNVIIQSESISFSELTPERILQDLLRRLWSSVLRNRQNMLPAESNEENDKLRLTYSVLARRLERGAWSVASKLMSLDALKI